MCACVQVPTSYKVTSHSGSEATLLQYKLILTTLLTTLIPNPVTSLGTGWGVRAWVPEFWEDALPAVMQMSGETFRRMKVRADSGGRVTETWREELSVAGSGEVWGLRRWDQRSDVNRQDYVGVFHVTARRLVFTLSKMSSHWRVLRKGIMSDLYFIRIITAVFWE